MAVSSQQHFLQTQLPAIDANIVIVYTAWNSNIVHTLRDSAVRFFESHTGKIHLTLIEVPGAVEIPFAIQNYYHKSVEPIDAFIALGCVIKGDTPHFEYVCQAVTQGLSQLNIELDCPVIFGVLTVLNEQQAIDRIKGGRAGDKGEEAAITALKMIDMVRNC